MKLSTHFIIFYRTYQIFLSVVFVVLFFTSNAQIDIKKYVKKNIVQILSINPEITDYSDLEIIGEKIGDSRIVMLGEASHGDASTFLAKTRLIQYLHEKKGFNVLAFESDFYALNRCWDLNIQHNLSIDSFYYTNQIHSVWTRCEAMTTLFYKYLPKSDQTSKPIIITGFDNQIFGLYSQLNFRNEIDSYLMSQQIPYVSKLDYKNTFLPQIDSIILFRPFDSLQFVRMISILDTIDNELLRKNRKDEFWYLCFQNFKQYALQRFYYQENDDWKVGNKYRDQQMSNNLKWLLLTKYPNEKFIVWAHNGHINKNPEYYNSMGDCFTLDSSLNLTTYIIGFTSREGYYFGEYLNDASIQKISKPMRNSFENWISKKIDYGFIDFKEFNELNPNAKMRFYMKTKNHNNYYMDWTHSFDGIVYIREMLPCTIIKK